MSGKPGQNLLLFVHSSIDDASLSTAGFFVLGHLAKLADRSGALIEGRAHYSVWDISSLPDRNPGGAR
jgi:hypothetical protein